MTISNLVALEFATQSDFERNLDILTALIGDAPEASLIAAPEVCLTGFCYDRMADAAVFAACALSVLCRALEGGRKIVVMTLIERAAWGGYVNNAVVIGPEGVIVRRAKAKLFHLGGEERHFCVGEDDSVIPVEIGGLKIGILICYELRFIALWERLKGSDIVVVPAMWGVSRAAHYATLVRAVALTLQCHVIAASSPNEQMAGGSAVIDPWGIVCSPDEGTVRLGPYDARLAATVRRQLPL